MFVTSAVLPLKNTGSALLWRAGQDVTPPVISLQQAKRPYDVPKPSRSIFHCCLFFLFASVKLLLTLRFTVTSTPSVSPPPPPKTCQNARCRGRRRSPACTRSRGHAGGAGALGVP